MDEYTKEMTVETVSTAAMEETPKRKKPIVYPKGYKGAHVAWLLLQILSVILFAVALVCLIISPIFPFIFGFALDPSDMNIGGSDLGGIVEGIAGIFTMVFASIIMVFLGVLVTIAMIVASFFLNIGALIAGLVGFLISVIARPKGHKWKAFVFFGITNLPPAILAIIECIVCIVIGIAQAFHQ